MATYTVANTTNTGAGSLRAVMAGAASGDTINFDSSLNGETIVLSSVLSLYGKSLIIDASDLPDGITISGNNTCRVFLISNASLSTVTRLINIHIQNGFVNSSKLNESYISYASGMYCRGPLVMERCKVTNCSVTGYYSQYGVGVYAKGNAEFYNCLIADNTYTSSKSGSSCTGCGMYCDGSSNTIKIVNCTIAGNSMSGSGTKEISGVNVNGSGNTVQVYNSIIANNTGHTYSQNSGITGDSSDIITTSFTFGSSYTLLSSSAAVNGGTNSYIEGYNLDLAGNPRINNDTVDIGCYEYCPLQCATPTLTLTAGAGTCTIEVSAKPTYADKLELEYSTAADGTYTSIPTTNADDETTATTFTQSNLNGTYYFRARWVDNDGVAEPSSYCTPVSIFIDGEAPIIGLQTATPLEITVGDTVDLLDGVTCTDNVDDATTLQPYYSISDANGDAVYIDDDPTQYINVPTTDLTVGTYTIYYYAIDAAGNESAEVTRTLNVNLPKLTAPTVTYTVATNSITLGITTDGTESGIQLRRAYTVSGLDSATIDTITPTDNEWPISNLPYGTTFQIEVRCVGDDVTYANSNWTRITATTLIPPTLAPPVISVSSAGVRSLHLAVEGYTANTSVDIRYSTTSGSFSSSTVYSLGVLTNGETDITGLQPGTTYYVQARYVGDDVNNLTSAWSEEGSASTESIPQLSTPEGLTATVDGTTQLTLGWGTVANASGYSVWMSTDGVSFDELSTPITNSLICTGLTPSTTYYFNVRAVGDDINYVSSELTETVSATTEAIPVLSTPTNFAITADGPTRLILSWDTVTGAGRYTVYRCMTADGTYEAMSTPTTNSYTDIGLVASTTYYYKVQAIGDGTSYVDSCLTGYVSGTTTALIVLSTPQNVTATVSSASEINITWSAVTNANYYEVYTASSENGAYTLVGATDELTYKVTGLKATTLYYYKVLALGDNTTYTNSVMSSAVSGTTFALNSTVGAVFSPVETDSVTLVSINVTPGRFYLCSDTATLWYDTSNGERIQLQ